MQFTLKDAFDADDLFDGIGIDYQGDVGIDVGVDVGVDVDVCVVDVDNDLLPAQMSLLADVNSRGTSGNP